MVYKTISSLVNYNTNFWIRDLSLSRPKLRTKSTNDRFEGLGQESRYVTLSIMINSPNDFNILFLTLYESFDKSYINYKSFIMTII